VRSYFALLLRACPCPWRCSVCERVNTVIGADHADDCTLLCQQCCNIGSGSDGETSSSVHSSTVSVTSSVRHASAGPFAPPLMSSSSLLLRRPQSQQHPQQLPLPVRIPATATPPQVPIPLPVLSKDVLHQPKTTGRVGILVIGLGGANGATMAAGILAHRHKIEWYGPRGQEQSPNWYGCLTQLHPDDTLHYGIGYRNQVAGLADASLAATGGWVRFYWLLLEQSYKSQIVSRVVMLFSNSFSCLLDPTTVSCRYHVAI
jgi:Myo-inositol-1-phosphate synthase